MIDPHRAGNGLLPARPLLRGDRRLPIAEICVRDLARGGQMRIIT